MASIHRLVCLRLRHRINWRLVRLSFFVGYAIFMVIFVLNYMRNDVFSADRLVVYLKNNMN